MNKSEGVNFLKTEVNPYLIPLLKSLMKEKPENSYEYILNWIDTKGKEIFDVQAVKTEGV